MRRLLLLAFVWGWSFLFIKVVVEGVAPTFVAWGRIVLAPVAGFDLAAGSVHFNGVRLLCLVLLGAVGTGYAYLLNYRTLQQDGATAASLVTYLIPIVGVAAGVIVLGEPFSYRLVVGGLIVALGIALTQGRLLGPREPTPESTAATAASAGA